MNNSYRYGFSLLFIFYFLCSFSSNIWDFFMLCCYFYALFNALLLKCNEVTTISSSVWEKKFLYAFSVFIFNAKLLSCFLLLCITLFSIEKKSSVIYSNQALLNCRNYKHYDPCELCSRKFWMSQADVNLGCRSELVSVSACIGDR
jgi:hypothetical protein